jgi:hypothetical protein
LFIFFVMGLGGALDAANETLSGPEGKSLEERLLRPDLGRQSHYEERVFQAKPGLPLEKYNTGRDFGGRMVKPEQALMGGRTGFKVPQPAAESGRTTAGRSGTGGMKIPDNSWSSRMAPQAAESSLGGRRYAPAERGAAGLERGGYAAAQQTSSLTGKMYAGPEAGKVRSDLQIIEEALSKAKPEDLPGHTLSIAEIHEILNRK